MNIRERVQLTLDTGLPDLVVMAEDIAISDSKPLDRYATFSVSASRYEFFASNKPLVRRENVHIQFFCKDKADKLTFPLRIVEVMSGAGFECWDIGTDLPKDSDAKYYALDMEFVWCEGLGNG